MNENSVQFEIENYVELLRRPMNMSSMYELLDLVTSHIMNNDVQSFCLPFIALKSDHESMMLKWSPRGPLSHSLCGSHLPPHILSFIALLKSGRARVAPMSADANPHHIYNQVICVCIVARHLKVCRLARTAPMSKPKVSSYTPLGRVCSLFNIELCSTRKKSTYHQSFKAHLIRVTFTSLKLI